MAERRYQLAQRIEELGAGSIKIIDPGTGWPATAEITAPGGVIPVALHVGPVGRSQRGRDDIERRFQNPGKTAVRSPPGFLPVLLGLWEEEGKPIFVGMDALTRLGRETRQSLFVPIAVLRSACQTGWVEHFSTTGEKIVAFHPALLPVYVEMRAADVEVDPADIRSVLDAAGVTGNEGENAVDRGRRTALQLIRDARFSKDVRASYGELCAMCGIDYGLVVGAHVYPASAPGSSDKVWNGIALCQNHHAAFDAHQIYVDPKSYELSLHPVVLSGASRNAACDAFVRHTFSRLRVPDDRRHHPRGDMLEKRYTFYNPKYDWVV